MELQQLRYFVALSETLNFTLAAEKCGISQPALTRAIKSLEDELGVQLIRRERRRTHLTSIGTRIKSRFEQAISLAELAKQEAIDFSKMENTALSIGVMCTIGPNQLISLVTMLTSKAPDLQLKLHVKSGRELSEMLLAGDIDTAILGLPDYPGEFLTRPLYRERYAIAFPKGHRFANLSNVPLKKLHGEKYLSRINCEYLQHLESKLFEFDIDLDIRHESEHEDWVQAMIIAGMGCACLPEHMALFPELQTRPLVDPEIYRTISIATVRGRPHTPTVDTFSQVCCSMEWGCDLPTTQ